MNGFYEQVIAVLKQHGWDDAGGVLRYPTEQDLIDNWAKILFQNNADIDRLNGCPLTQSEMAQVIEQIETLKTPLALNGFINGKTVAVTRDNPDDESSGVMHVAAAIKDQQRIVGVVTVAKPSRTLAPIIERGERTVFRQGLLLLGITLLIGSIFTAC